MFDGTEASLNNWKHWQSDYRMNNNLDSLPLSWNLVEDPVDEGIVLQTCCDKDYGDEDIITLDTYTDFQLHVEFILISEPRGKHPANSGVYLQNRYEIQIKDDYDKELNDHDCGSIIDERAAPENYGRPRGQWQAYDITFRAARVSNGKVLQKPRVTVYWNGNLIHQDWEISKTLRQIGRSGQDEDGTPAGLKLQNEGHDVRFRNLWIKPLNIEQPNTDFGY